MNDNKDKVVRSACANYNFVVILLLYPKLYPMSF